MARCAGRTMLPPLLCFSILLSLFPGFFLWLCLSSLSLSLSLSLYWFRSSVFFSSMFVRLCFFSFPLGSAFFFSFFSSVNLCSEDEGEAGVRWLFLWFFFPCFCFVCFSLFSSFVFLPSVLFSGFYKAREGLVSRPPEMAGIVEARDRGFRNGIVGIVAVIS